MAYKEVQSMIRNKVFWVFLVPLPFLTLWLGYGAVQQIFLDRNFGTKPVSDIFLLLIFLALALLFCFLVRLKLTIEANASSLSIKFDPLAFIRREVTLDSIKTIEVVSYDAIGEHGGWGWRVGSFGKAFTAYGQKAVKVVTNAGETILVGTQRPHELMSFLKDST